jgi:hypothetical protein
LSNYGFGKSNGICYIDGGIKYLACMSQDVMKPPTRRQFNLHCHSVWWISNATHAT